MGVANEILSFNLTLKAIPFIDDVDEDDDHDLNIIDIELFMTFTQAIMCNDP